LGPHLIAASKKAFDTAFMDALVSATLILKSYSELVSVINWGMFEWHVFCWVEEKLVFFRKKGGFFFFWGVFFAWWGLGGFSFFACCFWN